jgi:ParB-like chromosome segregation protein Spo0J
MTAVSATIVRMDISDLVPNPRNPRVHPVSQIDRLKASLQRDGQTKPVLVRQANQMLIAGHGITLAAQSLGWTALDVLRWNVDQETADRVMLADNRLGELSTSDRDRMAALLGEIAVEDYMATGFSEEEAAKLMGVGEDDAGLEVFEVETSALKDDFWVTVRGPLVDQAEVLARIKVLLKEYPQVDVELGTVKTLP